MSGENKLLLLPMVLSYIFFLCCMLHPQGFLDLLPEVICARTHMDAVICPALY